MARHKRLLTMFQFIADQLAWNWALARKSRSFGAALLCLGTSFACLSIATIVFLHSYTYNEEFASVERFGVLQKSSVHITISQDKSVVKKQRDISAISISEVDSIPLSSLRTSDHVSKHPPVDTTVHHNRVARKSSKTKHKKFNMTEFQISKGIRVSVMNEPIAIEPNLSPTKGYYINYSNHYADGLTTSGSYYKYNHEYSTPCYLNSISLKYDEVCDKNLPLSAVRQVLVVAVQRSGTHFTWEMLNRLNVTVHHEGVGAHGAVGWPYSVRATSTIRGKSRGSTTSIGFGKGYIINNPEKLRSQRFQYVFHQVRHPLRVISTLMSRCNQYDKFWTWISKIRLEHFREMHKDATPLTRAMLLYYYWNRHIESYADLRFQTETTSPRDICSWAKFDRGFYCNRNVTLVGEEGLRGSEVNSSHRRLTAKMKKKEVEEEGDTTAEEKDQDDPSNSTSVDTAVEPVERTDIKYLKITWAELDAENVTLSGWIKDMCVEYGFPLDPDLIPQNSLSRQFTA